MRRLVTRPVVTKPNNKTEVPLKSKIEKKRLDILIVERGLAESRQKAQAMILAGEVRLNDVRTGKAGTLVALNARIEVKSASSKYASRAGLKLEGAIQDFGISVADRICLDIGASTGGFTDCLLAHGARRVYSVDVTTDQMAWRLQQDSRVTQIKANARYLGPQQIAEPPDLVTIDVSFISVGKVLPAVVSAAAPSADFLILVKPQFELDRKDIGKGGIVRDPALHERAIGRARIAASESGLRVERVLSSRVQGAEGNQEFFLYAVRELVANPGRQV
jgi:23S rRNA (cytidine1920-2'-O)/16S rRNA (cytidine1409-2'-O)-methyltransferase